MENIKIIHIAYLYEFKQEKKNITLLKIMIITTVIDTRNFKYILLNYISWSQQLIQRRKFHDLNKCVDKNNTRRNHTVYS